MIYIFNILVGFLFSIAYILKNADMSKVFTVTGFIFISVVFLVNTLGPFLVAVYFDTILNSNDNTLKKMKQTKAWSGYICAMGVWFAINISVMVSIDALGAIALIFGFIYVMVALLVGYILGFIISKAIEEEFVNRN